MIRHCRVALHILCVSFVLTACGQERAIFVGVSLASEGMDGADLGIREFNGKGTLDGKPLRMRGVPDSLSRGKDQPTFARTTQDAFATDSAVVASIGYANAEQTDAAAVIANRERIPLIVPMSGGGAGPYVFHLMPPPEVQAKFLADQVKELWAPKRSVILYSNNNYGKAIGAAFAENIRGATKIELNEGVTIPGDSATMTAIAKRIVAIKPDVVFWFGRAYEMSLLIWPIREFLGDVKFMASDALESSTLYDNPEGVFDGVVFVRTVDPQAGGPRYTDFQWRYLMWMNRKTTSQSILAYDAARLISEALRNGATTRTALRDYFASLGRSRPAFDGVGGMIKFDENGWALDRPLHLAEMTADGVQPAGLHVKLPTTDSTLPAF